MHRNPESHIVSSPVCDYSFRIPQNYLIKKLCILIWQVLRILVQQPQSRGLQRGIFFILGFVSNNQQSNLSMYIKNW